MKLYIFIPESLFYPVIPVALSTKEMAISYIINKDYIGTGISDVYKYAGKDMGFKHSPMVRIVEIDHITETKTKERDNTSIFVPYNVDPEIFNIRGS